MKQGLTQIYTGDGKGKTTAAIGLAIRAVGRRQRVVLIQFLKNDSSGELILMQERLPEITVLRFHSQNTFIWEMNDEQREILRAETVQGLLVAKEIAETGNCDLLILDEVLGACTNGFISTGEILELMMIKSKSIELVLTGRNASAEIIAAADLVTEMKKVKHPFDRGIAARTGIER